MENPSDRPSPVVLRLAAAIIDFTAVIIVVLPIQLLWTVDHGGRAADATPTTGSNWVALAIIAGYPIVSTALYGRTLGKHLCSLRVRRRGGRPVGWTASIVRFAVSIAPLAAGPLLVEVPAGAARTAAEVAQLAVMIGIYVPILVDPQRRGLHDRIAGTEVICRVPAILRGAMPPLEGDV